MNKAYEETIIAIFIALLQLWLRIFVKYLPAAKWSLFCKNQWRRRFNSQNHQTINCFPQIKKALFQTEKGFFYLRNAIVFSKNCLGFSACSQCPALAIVSTVDFGKCPWMSSRSRCWM